MIAVIEQNNLTKYDNEAIKSCLKDVKKAAGKKQDKPVKSNKPKVKKRQPKIGDLVIVDGKIYGNGDGSGGSLSKKSEKMFVVDIVDSKKYKYFIGVAALKTSARQGWGNLKCIKKSLKADANFFINRSAIRFKAYSPTEKAAQNLLYIGRPDKPPEPPFLSTYF